jgi:FKBP-type peptidyl-prolyl cis-trans isomerase SlyD
MQIAKDSVVSFDYTLTGPDGKVIDTSDGRAPLTYLHGAGSIIPGLESQLAGKQAGDSLTATVAPDQAYGVRNEQLAQTVSRSHFPPNQMLMVGQQFQARGPNGSTGTIRISKIDGDNITVDANHPLAGMTLTFAVKIVEVRAATPEEVEHGHVHGPGGHQH